MTVRPDARYPGPTLADRAQWMLRARPADYLLAMSVASASLPVVGKHFEPLGGYTAMGVWGYRHAPEILASTMKSWLRPGACNIRRGQRDQTQFVSDAALRGVVPAADLDIEWPVPERAAPVLKALQHRRHVHRTSVRYGEHPSQLLDVWRRGDLPSHPAPVMVFVPGRGLGARQPDPAGLCADVTPGGQWLGVPVGGLPGVAQQPRGRSTSPTSRPRSPGPAPTSTGSAGTATSWPSRDVRPAAISPRWPV